MSYSYSYSQTHTVCDYTRCSDGIIADINSGDQDRVCAHPDLSCVDGCISTLLLEAHCACETGLLFDDSINSFNFVGEPYCCGSDACKDAVLNLHMATNDDASSLSNDTYSASKALHDDECIAVNCTSVISPSVLPISTEVPSLTPVAIIGAPSLVPTIKSGAPSLLPSANFVVPTLVPTIKSGAPSLVPVTNTRVPTLLPTMYTNVPSLLPSIKTNAPSAPPTTKSWMPSFAPTFRYTEAPSTQPTTLNQAPSSQPTIFIEAPSVDSMSYSYSYSQSNNDCDYSSCSDAIIIDIDNRDQDRVCAHPDLSCIDGCISTLLLEAHCACETGLLFHDSFNSFNFFGELYCCGSDACKDAVLNLFLATNDDASSLSNDTYSASKAVHDDECVAVNCSATSAMPTPAPTLIGGGVRRLFGRRRLLESTDTPTGALPRSLSHSAASLTFSVNGRLGLSSLNGVPNLEYQTADLYEVALEAALHESYVGGSLEADVGTSCNTSISIATITVNPKREFPTLLPTPVPTEPSPIPSSAPTEFECPIVDSTKFSRGYAYDPSANLELAKPVVAVSSGTAYPMADSTADGIYHSRKFGFFEGSASGSTLSFKATAADGTLDLVSPSNPGATSLEQATTVDMALKTRNVYVDSLDVEVAYQLHDAKGRTSVLLTGMSVTLTVTHQSTGESMTSSCNSPSASTGVGLCSSSLSWSSNWFNASTATYATAQVTLSYSTVMATSNVEQISLGREPVHDAIASAGMHATLPFHPLLPGETFTAVVYAYTGVQVMTIWDMTFSFDTSLLNFVKATTSTLYNAAVVTHSSSTGTISMSTSGKKSSASDSQLKSASGGLGEGVKIITLTFRTKSTSVGGKYSDVLRWVINSMTNKGNVAFVTNGVDADGVTAPVQVNDARGGAQSNFELDVYDLEYVSLFAYSALNVLVNTAPLTNNALLQTLTAVAVRNVAGYSNVVKSASTLTCTSSNEAVATTSGCVVLLSPSATSGASNLTVTVSWDSESITTKAFFVVWYPEALSLVVNTPVLSLVLPDRSEYSSLGLSRGQSAESVLAAWQSETRTEGCVRYQRSAYKVMATFVAPGGALPLQYAVAGDELSASNGTYKVDVSSLVTLASSNPDVASVSTTTREVIGESDGNATVSFVVPPEDHAGIAIQGSVQVVVGGDNYQEVVKMVVVLVSNGDWSSYDQVLSVSTTPTMMLEHVLEHEGEFAQVLAYAYFSDGSWEDVSTEVNLTSTHEFVDVAKERGVVGTATVAVGALLYCWPVVKTVWAPCGVPLVEAHGTAMLNVSCLCFELLDCCPVIVLLVFRLAFNLIIVEILSLLQ